MSDIKNAPSTVILDDIEYEAEIAQILERGHSHQALNVDLTGTGLHGEWVRNDPVEITRAQTLGFSIDTEHASKNPIHSDGTRKAIFGDVIFMTIPAQKKLIIDRVQRELARRRHGEKKNDKLVSQQEDNNFKGQMAALEPAGISAIDLPSDSKQVSGEEIKAALSSTN